MYWLQSSGLLLPYLFGIVCFILGFCANKLINVLFTSDGAQKSDWVLQEEEKEIESDSMMEEPSNNDFLLSTAFRPALLLILNQSDPVTFAHVSMTFRGMRTVCRHSRGLRVPFPCKIVMQKGYNSGGGPFRTAIRFKYLQEGEGYRVASGRQLEHLKRMPFNFQIDIKIRKDIESVDEEDIFVLDTYIRQFSKFSVKKVVVDEGAEVNCWPEMITFIKEHRVANLIALGHPMDEEEEKSLLGLKFLKLEVTAEVPAGMLCQIGAERAVIIRSNVTSGDFRSLVQHISSGNLNWIKLWHMFDLNEDFSTMESFVNCFDGIANVPFNHNGVLPPSRPLTCFSVFPDCTQCFLLTKENLLFCFTHCLFDLNRRPTTELIVTLIPCEKENEYVYHDLPEAFRPFVIQ